MPYFEYDDIAVNEARQMVILRLMKNIDLNTD